MRSSRWHQAPNQVAENRGSKKDMPPLHFPNIALIQKTSPRIIKTPPAIAEKRTNSRLPLVPNVKRNTPARRRIDELTSLTRDQFNFRSHLWKGFIRPKPLDPWLFVFCSAIRSPRAALSPSASSLQPACETSQRSSGWFFLMNSAHQPENDHRHHARKKLN